MMHVYKWVPVAALTLSTLSACEAPEPSPSSAEQVYRNDCLLCHSGSGSGASAPDLTTLSIANGGSFPMDAVISIIDGRAGVRPHDSPMPVWGERRSAEEVRALAAYLADIQQ